MYPFDTLVTSIRIELSHFEIKVNGEATQFRFDMYRQHNQLSYKEGADGLPEFGIDYEATRLIAIEENKEWKDEKDKKSPKIKLLYYPGTTLMLELPRNPVQPCIQFFLPNLILSIFIMASSNILQLSDMLATVSLSLLTLVGLY